MIVGSMSAVFLMVAPSATVMLIDSIGGILRGLDHDIRSLGIVNVEEWSPGGQCSLWEHYHFVYRSTSLTAKASSSLH